MFLIGRNVMTQCIASHYGVIPMAMGLKPIAMGMMEMDHFFLNQGTNTLTLCWYTLNASPLLRRDCASVIGIPVTLSSRYKIIAGLMIAIYP